jgi:hypothetical protein
LASDLSALGHVDIAWLDRRWSVAPPTLNLVPDLWLCVVLTGSRPHYVDERFEEATDDLDTYPFEVSQPPAPAAKLAKCGSVETVEHVADGLGARLVIDPARSLVNALRPVDEMSMQRAPEPSLEEAQRFDPQTLRWSSEHRRQRGLYRVDLHGRPVHRRLDVHGLWWAVDLPSGQFLELRDRMGPVVRWRSPLADGRRPSCLEVRRELSLPILAERAATVSSGLVPCIVDGWRRYLNVPQDLAATIAERLLQKPQIVWEDR